MAKCPFGAHAVPDLADGDLEVGDAGICGRCQQKYKVTAINPYKLARSGKKPT